MAYTIEFTSQAVKTLRKMPHEIAATIRSEIGQIAGDPFAHHANVTKLQNRDGFRLRIGDWQVIYDVYKDRLVVSILKIRPRGEVYR